VVVLPLVFIFGGALEGSTEPFLGGLNWQSLALSLWEQFLCMAMVVGLLVIFRERLNFQGRLAKEMSASAYTVFLIHAPVIVILALALRGSNSAPIVQIHPSFTPGCGDLFCAGSLYSGTAFSAENFVDIFGGVRNPEGSPQMKKT
jgi:hypothetical protein